MASFIVRERKADPTKPHVPKEFKEFSLPSVKLGSLEEVDALIDAFEGIGSDDVVEYLKEKTKKFR
jgi:hypothetical protein